MEVVLTINSQRKHVVVENATHLQANVITKFKLQEEWASDTVEVLEFKPKFDEYIPVDDWT